MSANTIPGYTLKKKIGEGAMASVFLAKEEKLDRHVALKVMSKKLLSDPSFADRFLREARIVASISHRNIVTVFDVGSHESFHYMAMELLPGGDMSAKLKEGIPLDKAISYVIDIAEGLYYAGSKNLIHRDIKPDNIMFAEDGRAVITDFGIARDATSESNMTMAGSVIGTPQYMSPEQAGAKDLDHRTDLYSLGIILYQILSGRTPFKGDSAIATGIMHIKDKVPPLPPKHAQFQNFIDKALAKDPDDRYQSGKEFIAALKRVSLDAPPEDNEATVILSADDMASISGEYKASEPAIDIESDLSDEFLADEEASAKTPIEETKSTKAAVLEESLDIDIPDIEEEKPPTPIPQSKPSSEVALESTEEQSESVRGQRVKSDNTRTKEALSKAKKEKVSGSFPTKLVASIVIVLTLLVGHVYYVNIQEKRIPFSMYATKLTNLAHETTGKAPDFYKVAKVFSDASVGFGEIVEGIIGKEKEAVPVDNRVLDKERQYVELFSKAIREGRLYAPRFDCAELYFMELTRLNPNSEVVTLKANELLAHSLDLTFENLNRGKFGTARKLYEDTERVLNYSNDKQLKERYSQVAGMFN